MRLADEPASSPGEAPSAAEPEVVAARLLIVDDEPLLGKTLKLAFSGRHDVVVAVSGQEAIDILERDQRFDMILCDLMMPDVSGMSVYEHVSRSHPDVATRFVFMTGGAFTGRAREFLENFPGHQLEKPFDVRDVERVLEALHGAAQPR